MLLTDELIDNLLTFRVAKLRALVESGTQAGFTFEGKTMGSGYACWAGDGSPMTQVYGVGHRDSEFDLDEIDAFYEGRATNWELVATPFTSKSLLTEAVKRGYLPDHFETVLGQLASSTSVELQPGVEIERVSGDMTEWMRVNDAGWMEQDELPDEVSDLSRLMAATPAYRYLARVNGEPAAAAGLASLDGKFLFAGACTLPKYRGRGIQRAFTQRRLNDAGPGSFVQVVATPGTVSHRNLQKVGFDPLYSKLVMMRR